MLVDPLPHCFFAHSARNSWGYFSLRNYPYSQRRGSIGEAGGGPPEVRFAIFPTADIGRAAKTALLEGQTYRGLTINQVIARYDKTANAAYQDFLQRVTGLSGDAIYSDLPDSSRATVRGAMEDFERGRSPPPGNVYYIFGRP